MSLKRNPKIMEKTTVKPKKTTKSTKDSAIKSNVAAIMGSLKGKITVAPDCWDDDDVPRNGALTK